MWAMGWMMFGMILLWTLLILAAIGFVKLLFQSGTSQPNGSQGHLTPMQVLDLRYSRGEITHEQYQQMKKDLNW